jgi:amino acid transporter
MKQKGLSAGRLTLLALGTVIGGSFFLGSSVAINAAGAVRFNRIRFRRRYCLLYSVRAVEMTVANQFQEVSILRGFRVWRRARDLSSGGFIGGKRACHVSVKLSHLDIDRTWIPGLPVALLGGAIIAAVTGLNLLGADKSAKELRPCPIKLLAIISFLFIAVLLITVYIRENRRLDTAALDIEPFMPRGFGGLRAACLS